ncbi:cell division protein FtsQ/DivIB [Metabacillus malikii]|uniref:Cell division protein DivIB n=1 Tax=Metabacillus malikii TaxID=1504265 RepID=A0ABT9ZG54_9BACI|nr:FtsQ-type POTRA domain-containing protein [Metabacillus malikii]MDQ0231267.1 cell division protein FtsQ [Metabacillus malikii]
MEKKVVSLEERIPKLQQQRKQKSNRRLILFLSLFFILILLVIYFQSPLSKVGNVSVKGNKIVPTEDIIKLSGITSSSGYWNINEDKVIKDVSSIVHLKDVKVVKKFPNSIEIIVQEFQSIAYLEKGNAYLPILDNGQVLNDFKESTPADAPVLINWENDNAIKVMIEQLTQLSPAIVNSISEIHHTPEDTDPWLIRLYMNDGYEVIASVRTFSEKMDLYPSIVSQLEEDSEGVIHLEVGSYFESYKPLGEEEEDEGEIEG